MIFAYLDEFGHIGPYFEQDQALPPHDKSPGVQAKQEADSGLKGQGDTNAPDYKAEKPPAAIPQAPSRSLQNDAEAKAGQSQEEGTEFWPPFYGVRLKITDSLLALFTLLLWWSTARLVRGADKTAERQLRAYVTSNHWSLAEQTSTTMLQVQIAAFNTGQTPAYDIYLFAKCDVFPYPLPKDTSFPEFTDDVRSVSTVGSQKFILTTADMDRFLSDIELKEIRSGSKRIYAFGIGRYKDIFRVTRTTKFCYAVIWSVEGPIGGEHTLQHNEAD